MVTFRVLLKANLLKTLMKKNIRKILGLYAKSPIVALYDEIKLPDWKTLEDIATLKLWGKTIISPKNSTLKKQWLNKAIMVENTTEFTRFIFELSMLLEMKIVCQTKILYPSRFLKKPINLLFLCGLIVLDL